MSSPLVSPRVWSVLAALCSAVSLGCAALMALNPFVPAPVGFVRLVLGASTGFVLAAAAAGAPKTWRGRGFSSGWPGAGAAM